MKVLKIAFLLTQSLESPSGLGRFGPMARELAKRGHQVEVYALHPDFENLQSRIEHPNDRLAVQYVAPMHVQKSGSQKSYYSAWRLIPIALQATIRLSQVARSSPADILHICKPHPMNSVAGRWCKAGSKKTIYLDCDDYEAGVGHFSGAWQKSVIGAFEKWVPSQVTAVTTNTHFMEAKLISWGCSPEKITYIPNGVELSRFHQPAPVILNQIRAAQGLTGKRVISYIGSVGIHAHPVDLLLEAFARVRARFSETALLIVGGGEDLETLKAQAARLGIERDVRFTGRIAPDEVARYYYLSDVTVDPVYDDDAARGRSPLKLFESWACGVPFVSANVGDRAELIGTPPAGLLAQPGDSDSLSQAILQVFESPGFAEAIRQVGLQRVTEYSWDKLVTRLENLYLQSVD
jgi:glycosyltransferase involved in cell wall biosynthesis